MSEAVSNKQVSRKEHLEWCKKRAMEAMQDGNYAAGWASFMQDMVQHPETKNHVFLATGNSMVLDGRFSSKEAMEKHIDGFN